MPGNKSTRRIIGVAVIFLLFVIAVLLLSNLVLKTTRMLVDSQYGRANAAVRLKLENEAQFFSGMPIDTQLKLYRRILHETGRYSVWQLLFNF